MKVSKFFILISAFCVHLSAQEPPSTPAAPDPKAEEFGKAVYFGKKFFDLKEYVSAYDQYAKADAVRPDDPGVLYNMAVTLAKAGRYSEAQVKADRYVQLFPTGAERPLIAKLQLELEFQRELQKKRQADEDYAELFNRGKFLYGKSELPAALKLFQEAEQLRPADPSAVYNQAVIYDKQGDLEKAAERFRRYAELESDADAKAGLDQRLFALDSEIEDMKTKIVCAFCGLKLPVGATWCHRCWHGPYLTSSPVWNSRPCLEGASATRATYFSEDRFNKNDLLPCMFQQGTMLETLRYTPARQRAIRDARRGEGWSYEDDLILGWSDKQGLQIRFMQGPQYLEKIVAQNTGEMLTFAAHAGGEGIWLLDREDLLIDGQKYTNRYTFDSAGRIAQEQSQYQNNAACNHLISMTADYTYQNDLLSAVKLRGGYEGYVPEGAPKVEWQGTVAYAYDQQSRVVKEDFAVTSFNKTYGQKAVGALRDEVSRMYAGMRVKKPLENAMRLGDLCGTAGAALLSNPIDLRPFYTMSPNLAIALQPGVARATVTFTYPESYKFR